MVSQTSKMLAKAIHIVQSTFKPSGGVINVKSRLFFSDCNFDTFALLIFSCIYLTSKAKPRGVFHVNRFDIPIPKII